jgi:1,4-alpha-glucan branching enzyme
LPPSAFVDSLQTHDQIGNRAFGERISQLAHAAGRDDALRALVACVLLAPAPPMLFMGEEWGAASPFLYFCDYTGELAQAITQGRRAEFARAAGFGDTARRATIPDPNAASSFLRSKLDWSERTRPPHAGWLALYGDLLRLRRQHLQPWLGGAASGQASWPDPGTLRLSWPLGGGRVWHLQARLANHAAPARRAGELPGEVVYLSHLASAHLPAWSVACTVEHP